MIEVLWWLLLPVKLPDKLNQRPMLQLIMCEQIGASLQSSTDVCRTS